MAVDVPRVRGARDDGPRLLALGGSSRSREGSGAPLNDLPPRAVDDLVREVAARLAGVPHGQRIVLACSGGPDSTALALLVARARPDLVLTLAYVAHGLRRPADDVQDAERVTALADRLGATVRTLPVTPVRSGAGPEADARTARHAALEDLRTALDAVAVLYGHHADDQAETLLLRMARGTGIDGLAGMAAVAGTRLRPLLDIRRAELRAIVAAEGVEVAHDPMNDDPAVRRVVVRQDVLPALGRVAPDPVGALTRLAVLARDDAAALDVLTDDAVVMLPVASVGPVTFVRSDGLHALPRAIARRVLRRMLVAARGTAGDAVDVDRWLTAEEGWRGTLAGPVDATVERGWHVVAAVRDPDDVVAEVAVREDDRTGWPVLGWELVASPASAPLPGTDLPDVAETGEEIVLAPGLHRARLHVELPSDLRSLRVRVRRAGDRLRTPVGSRTLADVMGEAGVPRVLRDLLPVVVDADDRPLWVPGLVADVALLGGGTGTDARATPGVRRLEVRVGGRPGGRAGGQVGAPAGGSGVAG